MGDECSTGYKLEAAIREIKIVFKFGANSLNGLGNLQFGSRFLKQISRSILRNKIVSSVGANSGNLILATRAETNND